MDARPFPFISTDIDGAAEALGVSRREIQRAMAAGELAPSYRGTKPLFAAEDLYEWFRSLPTERGAR